MGIHRSPDGDRGSSEMAFITVLILAVVAVVFTITAPAYAPHSSSVVAVNGTVATVRIEVAPPLDFLSKTVEASNPYPDLRPGESVELVGGNAFGSEAAIVRPGDATEE